jgi:hypothetical protein
MDFSHITCHRSQMFMHVHTNTVRTPDVPIQLSTFVRSTRSPQLTAYSLILDSDCGMLNGMTVSCVLCLWSHSRSLSQDLHLIIWSSDLLYLIWEGMALFIKRSVSQMPSKMRVGLSWLGHYGVQYNRRKACYCAPFLQEKATMRFQVKQKFQWLENVITAVAEPR